LAGIGRPFGASPTARVAHATLWPRPDRPGASTRTTAPPGQTVGRHRRINGRATQWSGSRTQSSATETGTSGSIHLDHCLAGEDVWPASPDHWPRDPMVRVADVNLWRDDPDDRVADPIAARRSARRVPRLSGCLHRAIPHPENADGAARAGA